MISTYYAWLFLRKRFLPCFGGNAVCAHDIDADKVGLVFVFDDTRFGHDLFCLSALKIKEKYTVGARGFDDEWLDVAFSFMEYTALSAPFYFTFMTIKFLSLEVF